jgi:uncharacterized membrane protein
MAVAMTRAMAVAQLGSVILVGVVAGIFVATQIGQVRVQQTLGARDFTLVKHSFEVAVGAIMPVLVISSAVSIVTTLVLAGVAGDRPALILAGIALVLWAGVVVVTLIYNVPINEMAASWDPASPPADWRELRERWHLGQTIRTPLAVASFTALSLGALWPRLTS